MTDLALSRKISILAYLADHEPTLAELSDHFTTSPSKMRADLSEVFTTEYAAHGGFETPVDVEIPDNPRGKVILRENQTGLLPSLTLAEVISLLALIDDMYGSVDTTTRTHLAKLRERIAQAASEAGFGQALWPAPTVNLEDTTAGLVAEAIAERACIEISYLKAGADLHVHSEDVVIAPVSLTTGSHPLLIAAKDSQLRTYRLDRITDVKILDQHYTRDLGRNIQAQYKADAEFSGRTVRIVCTPQARWVAETIPVESATEESGMLVIDMTVSSMSWLRTLLIRIGEELVHIEPDTVRDEMVKAAHNYLEVL
ncbi:helix-turn-helix transcriptional regulator [Trueperella bialowiezensis]|uniref:Uncharacterized protein n=1 Tax=Trueperella bialowiezensis TaxID=312285 RepID=A0A448PBT6_9ACTO|nr:WYL domain-containing protein [Trueperella bialowiezensis]VEI12431.1 Uncharacterised protein [Trueperella bialowiezensis]